MGLMDLDKYLLRLNRVDLLPCRGAVVRVAGLTVESKGPPVGVGELCEIRMGNGRRVLAEVVGFSEQNRILLPLEGVDGIAPGDTVLARTAPRYLQLGESILGRVIDGLGRPIDNKGALVGEDRRALDNAAPAPLSRRRITEALELGIRAFDGLLTCGKGQRVGIFSGSGVGKSTLLGEIAKSSSADVNVVCLVGERGREVKHFLEESLGPAGLARSVVVVATSDASPIQRVKSAFTAISIAEYFRDQGRDVLMLMDSITRFAQSQREIGLAAGEPPTTRGYCPSVFSLMPKLTERLGCSSRGSITGILTVLVEGDDMNDPVADSVRSLLDGHIVLTRKLAERGHYPAIDICQSISRLMTSVTTPAHQQAAMHFRQIYTTYLNNEDLINIGALTPGHNAKIDRAVSLMDRINEFLVQPTGTRTTFEETAAWMGDITQSWEALLGGQPAAQDSRPAGTA